MFIYFADAPKSAYELTQAKRRDRFANVLLKFSPQALEMLLQRAPHQVDLELTGCENAGEYRALIRLMLSHMKATATEKKKESVEMDGGIIRAMRLDLNLDGAENIAEAKSVLLETLKILDG